MEFWGVEVKPNQTLRCELGGEKYLHLSMSALGESKKGAENAVVYVTFNGQKLVIGTLSTEKCAQISHDLVFENDFELSHSAKNASVYFTGYKSFEDEEDFDGYNFSDDEEEDALAEKPSKVVKTTADEDDSDDDSSDEDVKKNKLQTLEEDSEEDESSEEEEEDDSEEEESSEEEEETPEAVNGKKRPAEAAAKAASPVKKAKLETPADGKKVQSSGSAKKSAPAKGKEQTSAKAKGKGGAK